MPIVAIPSDYFSGGRNIAEDPDSNRELADLINELITQCNSNESGVGGMDTDGVANVSGVAGASCSLALDQLATDIGALTTGDIADASSMGLADLTACIDALDGRAGSFISDENLAVAATVTERRFVATADGVIERFGAQAAGAAAAGESCDCDVQINGVTALTATAMVDNAAATGYVTGTVDPTANTFTAGDVITVVKTYVAGGAPAPMTDICAPVQVRLT